MQHSDLKNQLKIISRDEWLKSMAATIGHRKYGAMYSSWAKGIVTDVDLMVVPADDHLVHRGDGVFEALFFNGLQFFELEAHLDRLVKSAGTIGLKLTWDKDQIAKICGAVVQASGLKRGYMRIFVSRGPGDFSPNPYTTVGSQLYVLALPEGAKNLKLYESGARLIFSKVPIKPFPYAQVKSCNYLQNVMTKKDAVDQGADFAVNITDDGFVGEGPTENLLVLTAAGDLIAPPFDYTLRGTTLLRVLDIASRLKTELGLKFIGERALTPADLRAAREVMMVGTTLGVLPITTVDAALVGDGKVGVVSRRLDREISLLMGRF